MTSSGTLPSLNRMGRMAGPFRRASAMIEKAASTDLPVLIVGETGTGKELAATQIHRLSERTEKPFVPVNAGALPRELIASELFGHCKGSFTGATNDTPGRFREANGGTLFLDEIGTMDEAVQISLLRALETGTFRPVGASHDRHVDIRLIAATNEDPRQLVESGEFREDLLYRFEVMRIDLPPLRDVRDEIPELVGYFVDRFSREYEMKLDGVSPRAMEVLIAYDWPGNVRELKNVLAQACVLAEHGTIDLCHLPSRWHGVPGTSTGREESREAQSASSPTNDESGSVISEAVQRDSIDTPADSQMTVFTDGVLVPFGATLEEVQKQYALKTLEACGNNKTRAAKSLGVSRKTLYDRMTRWGCK